MRKIIAVPLFVLLLMLTGCNNVPLEDEETIEKQEEMTQEEALDYIEQFTYRLVEASLEEDGSYSQTSFLQAALAKYESTTKKINDKYNDSPLTKRILKLGDHAELGAEKGLEGDLIIFRIHLDLIIEEVKEISAEYLGGELPISIKVLEGL